jgi:hypothetical protein
MEAGTSLRLRGLGEDFLRSLERRILVGIHRAKALFPDRGDHRLSPWKWLIDVAESSAHPVYRLNRLSIAAGWGAVFCSLTAVAGRRADIQGMVGSHEIPTAASPIRPIDSG